MKILEKRLRKIISENLRNVGEKYDEVFKTREKLERNFKEIIVKYEKNLNLLENLKRKQKH